MVKKKGDACLESKLETTERRRIDQDIKGISNKSNLTPKVSVKVWRDVEIQMGNMIQWCRILRSHRGYPRFSPGDVIFSDFEIENCVRSDW